MEEYCKIISPYHGRVQFKLTPSQKYQLHLIQKCKILVVKKERQIGYTTLMCAYFLWYAIFHSDKVLFFGSYKLIDSRCITDKLIDIHESLPSFLKMGIDNMYGKKGIRFENGSTIMSEAISQDTVKGIAFSLIYLDEAASYNDSSLNGLWANVMPTICGSRGKMIMASSVLNGAGSFNSIYRTYPEIKAGESDEDLVMLMLSGIVEHGSVSVGRV